MSLFLIDIENIKGVGKKSAELFRKIGVKSAGELIEYRPISYEDLNKVSSFEEAFSVRGKKIIETVIKEKYKVISNWSNKKIFTVSSECEGHEVVIKFFGQKYTASLLEPGQICLVMGETSLYCEKAEIICRRIYDKSVLDEGLIPVYPQTAGLNSKKIAKTVKEALKLLEIPVKETLPENITKKFRLSSNDFALRKIHFPQNRNELERAKERLAFEELFIWNLAINFAKNKKTAQNDSFKITDFSSEFIKKFPFKLTNSQKKIITKCASDMKNKAMRRLLQGDVGSGKTAIAMTLAFSTLKSSFQVAIMVPTEILAAQHFENFKKMFPKDSIELITGSSGKKAKEKIIRKFESGNPGILIGTHSLISEGVKFVNLALVITDEQHRFGTFQRENLISKGVSPHTLIISATPIPRSLALVTYGDLDFSSLDEMPPGRKKVKTFVISGDKRANALKFLEKKLMLGAQGYIVCAAINDDTENELWERPKKNKTEITVENYRKNFLTKDFLKKYKTEIIHGKMKLNEKKQIMENFINGETKVLISTTIIEVGVDVPQATVMIIENAELFGLSTLHQLRGRVGRGHKESFCILISDKCFGDAAKRLMIMKNSDDGFFLAENDLKIRGPGEFFGKKQHGKFSTFFVFAITNPQILQNCKNAAEKILSQNPNLEGDEFRFIRAKVLKLIRSI
jgi:ATP-dependent DNA helicase RecG